MAYLGRSGSGTGHVWFVEARAVLGTVVHRVRLSSHGAAANFPALGRFVMKSCPYQARHSNLVTIGCRRLFWPFGLTVVEALIEIIKRNGRALS